MVLATYRVLTLNPNCAGGPQPSDVVLHLRAPLGRSVLLDGSSEPPSRILTPPENVIAVGG